MSAEELQKKVAELETVNTNLNAENNDLKNKIGGLEKEKADLNTNIGTLTTERDTQIASVKTLTADLEKIKKENENLKKTAEISAKTIKDLTTSNETSMKEIANLGKKIAEGEAKVKELNTINDGGLKKNEDLNKEVNRLECTITDLTEQRNQLKKEIETLTSQFEQKENVYMLERCVFEDAYTLFKDILFFYDKLNIYEKEKFNVNEIGVDVHKYNLKELLKNHTSTFVTETKKSIKDFINKQVQTLTTEMAKVEEALQEMKKPMTALPSVFTPDKIHQACAPVMVEIKSRKDEIERWNETLNKI